MGAIGNARWSGTRLGPVLEECGLSPEATEVVFFGVDRGKEEIRGNEYEQNFGAQSFGQRSVSGSGPAGLRDEWEAVEPDPWRSAPPGGSRLVRSGLGQVALADRGP